ncbi:hypothetical protein HF313_02840 [Massilia atriviolacea]|uniref:Uncharacterized protein n=1 Tax=Massilia atriviolacea TaxID=2495579 RepID=A0A430HP98_9BURK|nr:hypothetical protein [Massilia atriviolacea]RSZ59340.1 hypothetical protein EJB06_09230 [Massilia atriviolacea]
MAEGLAEVRDQRGRGAESMDNVGADIHRGWSRNRPGSSKTTFAAGRLRSTVDKLIQAATYVVV